MIVFLTTFPHWDLQYFVHKVLSRKKVKFPYFLTTNWTKYNQISNLTFCKKYWIIQSRYCETFTNIRVHNTNLTVSMYFVVLVWVIDLLFPKATKSFFKLLHNAFFVARFPLHWKKYFHYPKEVCHVWR